MWQRIKIVAVSSKSEARIRRGVVIPFRVVKYVTTLAALSNRDSNAIKWLHRFYIAASLREVSGEKLDIKINGRTVSRDGVKNLREFGRVRRR